jgi:hypothetical protein
MTGTNGANGANGSNGATIGTTKVKQGLAQMLKGGVIVSELIVNPCRIIHHDLYLLNKPILL